MSAKRLLAISVCDECTKCAHVKESGMEQSLCVGFRPNRVLMDPGNTIPSWCPLPKQDPDPHEDPRGWVT